jgi:hypothetical protein
MNEVFLGLSFLGRFLVGFRKMKPKSLIPVYFINETYALDFLIAYI